MSDEYPTPEHEHPALEGLRAERAEKAAKLATIATQPLADASALAAEIAELDERIEEIGTGSIRCRECGSDRIVAWYPEYARQGIEMHYEPDGTVGFDYTGEDYDHADDAGPDDEYWCLDCETHSRDLDYLVGVKLVEEYTMSDDGALGAIETLMDRQEWSPDTLDEVARIIRATGRKVRDSEDTDDTEGET